MSMLETRNDLLKDLGLDENLEFGNLDCMTTGETKYVKDLRMNVRNVLDKNEHLNEKEAALIALSIASNEKNSHLVQAFNALAENRGAAKDEIAEAHACASMLAVNNVFYRYKHFVDKDEYQNMPAKIRMNVMMKPVLGKEFFELISLAVSAVNGCEACVKSHEHSVTELGSSKERVFETIRLASVIRGLSVAIS